MKIDRKKLDATIDKWLFCRDAKDRWLTFAIIVAFVILFVLALTISASAHGIHFRDYSMDDSNTQPIGWVPSVGFVVYVDTDGSGEPDTYFSIYKHTDFVHSCLHMREMGELEVKLLFSLKKDNNINKGGHNGQ